MLTICGKRTGNERFGAAAFGLLRELGMIAA